MAACFQLTDKTTGEPVDLVKIDERICVEVLHCAPHATQYAERWYEIIGFKLAMGKTFEEVQADLTSHDEDEWYAKLRAIATFLDMHYTANAWATR